MDYAQYKKFKEEIEADYKKKKEALELLWSMYQKSNGAVAFEEGNSRGSEGSISDAIRKVLSGITGNFSVGDIQQGLIDYGVKGVERLSITNTLHRLYRRKEIAVVEKGQGRRASVYRVEKEAIK